MYLTNLLTLSVQEETTPIPINCNQDTNCRYDGLCDYTAGPPGVCRCDGLSQFCDDR